MLHFLEIEVMILPSTERPMLACYTSNSIIKDWLDKRKDRF